MNWGLMGNARSRAPHQGRAQGIFRAGKMLCVTRVLYNDGFMSQYLFGIMVGICHDIFVQTRRMYNIQSEP